MPRQRREIKDGMLRCSKCRKMVPYGRFHKDASQSSGYRSVCSGCLDPKLAMVDPDYEVIASSLVKAEPYTVDKTSYGAWERLARHAGLLTRMEAVQVNVGVGYRAHYTAATGITRAARRLKIKLAVEHWKSFIFVRNLGGI